MSNDKIIIIGDVEEEFLGTPVDNFKKAIELSKSDGFKIYTNDVQVVEALEVLCDEKNIHVYLRKDKVEVEIDVMDAYNFVGDIYRIINSLRFEKELNEDMGECFDLIKSVNEDIKEYEEKYDKLIKGED